MYPSIRLPPRPPAQTPHRRLHPPLSPPSATTTSIRLHSPPSPPSAARAAVRHGHPALAAFDHHEPTHPPRPPCHFRLHTTTGPPHSPRTAPSAAVAAVRYGRLHPATAASICRGNSPCHCRRPPPSSATPVSPPSHPRAAVCHGRLHPLQQAGGQYAIMGRWSR